MLVAAGAVVLAAYFIVIAANWLSARDRLAADTIERSSVLHPPQVATVARSLRTSAVILAILAAWVAIGAFW